MDKERLIYWVNRVDRDLFLSSESGETLSYLGTRSRATRSAEEARIEKKVGEKSEEKKTSATRRQLRRIPRHVRVYVLSFSLGKILSYKSTPAEKLLAREKTDASGNRRSHFKFYAAIELVLDDKLS